MQYQKELMAAFHAGDYSRALRMGTNALMLDPTKRDVQHVVELLGEMVDADSGTVTTTRCRMTLQIVLKSAVHLAV